MSILPFQGSFKYKGTKVGKAQRKQPSIYVQEKEENARHVYKVRKNEQNKKMQSNLERALRNRDYAKLVKMEDY